MASKGLKLFFLGNQERDKAIKENKIDTKYRIKGKISP
jgi:hypothetical protein